jgi:rsbT co-antagonist protein RsbR
MSSPNRAPGSNEGAVGADDFRLLVEKIQDYAIIMLDPAGLVVSWNRGAEQVKGYRAEEIIGQHFSKFYTPEDVAAGKPAMELRVAATKGRFEDEAWRVRKDGSRFWANVIITALRDDDGEVRSFAKVTRDRSEHRQTEEALAEEHRLLRTVIDALPDHIYVKDRESRVLLVNAAQARSFGLNSPEEAIGKTDFELGPAELAAQYRETELAIIQTGQTVALEEPYVTPAGEERCMSTVKTPLRDTHGSIIGVVGMSRDITERKRMQERLTQQAREILELSTPVVQLWEGVLALPLIGTLDSQRAQQITERLLTRIVETGSSVVIIDLTGVPTVDSQTGRHLIETIAAVRLLGAQTLLTGIRPEIAQTLVHLGIDLSGIVTRTSLSSGLRYAMEALKQGL